ncbi:7464_t:CDS:2 [Entrophospora sp. SA101]|nr:14515_t:CDS:2 [Entrophospora candida]CAJ0625513.1 7464_t:CDS:2 [Entrophospora sp. SA101]CAJ0824480.1 18823_t:CDS:2 [Entrophospora sp. SA101]CAJ0838452.1 13492_t:CDS:2 [Entrophospora sp. SA101]
MAHKSDPNKQGWEESEFPILCETCLGDNPYVRMTKQCYGKECKVCSRPFTIFRWLPGAGMRYKKTEICQTCAKLKNVCQTCLLDLQYNLPVQVRDTALNVTNDAPRSDINREYFAQNIEGKISGPESLINYGKADSAGKDMLKKLARTEPYYKRNRPHICSFYVKGNCTRGDECPYRHEIPEENELSHQNIKDRYYGTNDPVAKKMLNRVKGGGGSNITPPEDKTITSLFITGIEDDITESDLRGHFYAFGEIKSVVVVHKSKCAFVNYATRASAEQAVEKSHNNLNIKDHDLKISWGRPRPTGPKSEIEAVTVSQGLILPPLESIQIPAPPSQTAAGIVYPSQDPTYQGSTNKS